MRLDETHPLVYSYDVSASGPFWDIHEKRSQKRSRKMHYFAILSKRVQNFTVDLVTKICASSRRIERGAIWGVIDIGDERKLTLKKSWNFQFFAFISTFYIFDRNWRTKCRNRSFFFSKCSSHWGAPAGAAVDGCLMLAKRDTGEKLSKKVTNLVTLISPSVTLIWYGD